MTGVAGEQERETALAMALQEQHRCNAALQDQVLLVARLVSEAKFTVTGYCISLLS